MRRLSLVVLSAWCLASTSRAEVYATEAQALASVWPGAATARTTLYLTPEQVAQVQKEARSRLASPVVTTYEARSQGVLLGRAYLETYPVRTMPATTLVAVTPAGAVKAVILLRFAEPPDYLPREKWMETLAGSSLGEDLWPGRGVRRVTGATLTVQAITDAVRRALALDALVRRTP